MRLYPIKKLNTTAMIANQNAVTAAEWISKFMGFSRHDYSMQKF
jgi:hypothetical protein